MGFREEEFIKDDELYLIDFKKPVPLDLALGIIGQYLYGHDMAFVAQTAGFSVQKAKAIFLSKAITNEQRNEASKNWCKKV
ncbi:TPA: hypothetical protein ACGIK9_003413 [Acinetobacter baumannii]|uniref:hypothetical protein n=1 Tax=Acinetobacter baumannii TaxID=470 RepID=UPI00338E42D9